MCVREGCAYLSCRHRAHSTLAIFDGQIKCRYQLHGLVICFSRETSKDVDAAITPRRAQYSCPHIDVSAVLSMSRSRPASSEACHLGGLIPKTRLIFEQSRQEYAGRFARVGYSLLAIARTRHAGPPFAAD